MNIDFDELQGICSHNGSGGCDLQIENEAVTLMDGGEDCDNVECCEKQCPLNSDINKVENASANTQRSAIALLYQGLRRWHNHTNMHQWFQENYDKITEICMEAERNGIHL